LSACVQDYSGVAKRYFIGAEISFSADALYFSAAEIVLSPKSGPFEHLFAQTCRGFIFFL